jgi:shikimate kinase
VGKDNIALIGMPGSGKSTIGFLLAQSLRTLFIDTDLIIQKAEGRSLQDIIKEEGMENFLAIEEDVILRLYTERTVIATGGSVIYSSHGMKLLKKIATIIYLQVKCTEIQRRIGAMTSRGLILKKGQSLIDLYNERAPLYEKYADMTVNCLNKDAKEISELIRSRYQSFI